MISYRMMDKTCLVTTCLHKGPIPLAQCQDPESVAAYIETVAAIPQGSVARVLRDVCERYGACGVAAVEDDVVVGKISSLQVSYLEDHPAWQRGESDDQL